MERRGSTIREGGDTTISSPGRSPKQPLPGMILHDSLHGWQACPKLTHLTMGLVKYVPVRGYLRVVPSQNGDKYVTSPSPPNIELVRGLWTLHGSIRGLEFRSLPEYETIGFGCGVDAGEGSDQLALKDSRSDSIGYLGGKVRCFIRGGKRRSIFEIGAGVYGTVDKGRYSE